MSKRENGLGILAMKLILHYMLRYKRYLLLNLLGVCSFALVELGIPTLIARMINGGVMGDVLAGLDEATLQMALEGISALWTSPAYLFFLGGIERIVAVCLHVALSVLVWRAVRDGRSHWYWAAFGGHFAVDFAAVLLAGYSIIATEILVALMTAAIVWYAARAYKEAEAE